MANRAKEHTWGEVGKAGIVEILEGVKIESAQQQIDHSDKRGTGDVGERLAHRSCGTSGNKWKIRRGDLAF